MGNLSLNAFGQFVYDYCGLNYLKNVGSLELKTKKRLQQLGITNYWEYMRYVDKHQEEWTTIVELLTINETYFYREDKQLTVLQQEVVPQLLEKQHGPLKIWSAACSTGDEPYSIAMMLHHYIQEPNKKIDILATDINERVLKIAKKGAYSKSSLSFRRIPEQWVKTYFKDTPSHYVVNAEIRGAVHFDYANLYQLEQQNFSEQFDVIFCRNVLIYFDEQTIEKIAKAFHRALKKGGYLFLGHAETISKMNIGFKTINSEGTFYYQKE